MPKPKPTRLGFYPFGVAQKSLRHLDQTTPVNNKQKRRESGTLGTLSAVAEAIYGCPVETRKPYPHDYTVKKYVIFTS